MPLGVVVVVVYLAIVDSILCEVWCFLFLFFKFWVILKLRAYSWFSIQRSTLVGYRESWVVLSIKSELASCKVKNILLLFQSSFVKSQDKRMWEI